MARAKATAVQAERLQADNRRLRDELDGFTGERRRRVEESFGALSDFMRDELEDFPLGETREWLQALAFMITVVAQLEQIDITPDVDEWRAAQTHGWRFARALNKWSGVECECDDE